MPGKVWMESLTHTQTSMVWEWISNFIPYFMMDAITYPCWDYSKSMSVKGATDGYMYSHTLVWRHNGCGSVSNHQPHDCLLKRLFRRRSKKMRGIHRGPLNSPHKWPVTRKMFPFDDVIMSSTKHSVITVGARDQHRLVNFQFSGPGEIWMKL